jgi:hypothetical protein
MPTVTVGIEAAMPTVFLRRQCYFGRRLVEAMPTVAVGISRPRRHMIVFL